jgi:hypothetical protein
MWGISMKTVISLSIVLILLTSLGFGCQGQVDIDISITMTDIDRIEGSMVVPANIDLLMQGILKIFADSDSDGNITQGEADALLDTLTEEERANMSLRMEDLEPVIRNGIGIDFQRPQTVEVQEMRITGLVGPTNGSQPLGIDISFIAEFDVGSSIFHTISIGVNESYTGDVDFEFTAPEGWEVDSVTGLSGSTIEGRKAYGTPVSQINIRISEEAAEDVILLCLAIGIIVIVVIVLVIVLLLRSRKSSTTSQAQPQYPQQQASTPAPPQAYQTPSPPTQPYNVPPPTQPPQGQRPPPPQGQLSQTPPPPQYQAQQNVPPPPPTVPRTCFQCGGNLAYVQAYQRYYCPTCEQYR